LITGTSSSEEESSSDDDSFFAAAFLATATGAFFSIAAALGWILTSSDESESSSLLETATGFFAGTGFFSSFLAAFPVEIFESPRVLLARTGGTTFFLLSSSELESESEDELSTGFFFWAAFFSSSFDLTNSYFLKGRALSFLACFLASSASRDCLLDEFLDSTCLFFPIVCLFC
jgi:hypothetical protein